MKDGIVFCMDLMGWREEEEKKGKKSNFNSMFRLGRLASRLGRHDTREFELFYFSPNDQSILEFKFQKT